MGITDGRTITSSPVPTGVVAPAVVGWSLGAWACGRGAEIRHSRGGPCELAARWLVALGTPEQGRPPPIQDSPPAPAAPRPRPPPEQGAGCGGSGGPPLYRGRRARRPGGAILHG